MDLNVVTLPSLQRTTHAVISTAKKPAMSTRESKKKQTRQALMNAALELVGRGDNFASISLREVAKNAGVVPTSFYRHFETMEDLGRSEEHTSELQSRDNLVCRRLLEKNT